MLNAALQAAAPGPPVIAAAAPAPPAIAPGAAPVVAHVFPVQAPPAAVVGDTVELTSIQLPDDAHLAAAPGGRPSHADGRSSGQRETDGGQSFGAPRSATPAVPHAAFAGTLFPGQGAFAAALDRQSLGGAVGLPSFSNAELSHVGPQLIRHLHMQVKAGGGDVTLTLTPEHLGTVTIALRVEQNQVSAIVGADTPAVRGWIAAHEQDLKAGLANLGLQLDELVVREDESREQSAEQEQQSRQQSRRRRPTETSDTFEVRV